MCASAGAWCRSRVMPCRCSIFPASSRSTFTRVQPPACSTSRTWGRSRCVPVPAISRTPRALEALLPADILGLAPGRQRYTVLTNRRGGTLDDLIVANHGDHLILVVNAARKVFDETHLRSQ